MASLEQVITQTVQDRLPARSTRSLRPHPTPIEHMEPIVEERSELAIDIAQAVVEKLDIDRKLDERMRELMLRGDRIFREIQARQEQSTEALCRSVGMCLESQRSFHEEHQRLLVAVKELATMVIPFTPLCSQALEAQAAASNASATAIVQETEALKQQMEDHRSLCTNGSFSAPVASAPVSPATSQLPISPSSAAGQSGAGTFSITLRKADEVSLGLTVNADEKEDKTLLVERVLADGAVESWNRQCFGDATGERVVVAGDRIVRVNGIEGDVKKMLEACSTQRLVKLVVARGPASAHTRASATIGGSGQQPTSFCEAPSAEATSLLRSRAPEFVPSGADSQPLQPTQHLAAPPGLFFPRPADCNAKSGSDDADSDAKKMDAMVRGVVSEGYGDILGLGMQDIRVYDEADKEN